jgi:hypothetical protein
MVAWIAWMSCRYLDQILTVDVELKLSGVNETALYLMTVSHTFAWTESLFGMHLMTVSHCSSRVTNDTSARSH